MVELQSFGAAETVTGSMHVLHLDEGAVMMDCGMFQGRRNWARELNRTMPFPTNDVKAVLLSHAHIDHSGRIPLLVKNGCRAPIYATDATADLCKIMLADSGHIQEEDARYWNERRASDPSEFVEPMYTVEDAANAQRFFHGVKYDKPIQFADRCTATFMEAGHILGSACVLVEINRGDPIRILYTGDLGRFELPILKDPTNPLPDVDYLITESTYANRKHDNPTEMKEALARIINETRRAGGKVVIPSFSVGRTQHIVYFLSQAIKEGLMEPLPIYVDSPLSVRATDVFKHHPECYDEEARDFWRSEGEIFGRGLVEHVTEVKRSKQLNRGDESSVIISASGMCEAGRILHHLKNNIEDERNTVIIVGFQAQHTLGRRIVERRRELKIFGRTYNMMARVEVLNGFSAHADVNDFRRLLGPIAPKLKGAFVVHGEDGQLTAMEGLLSELGCGNVQTPKRGEKFQLQ